MSKKFAHMMQTDNVLMELLGSSDDVTIQISDRLHGLGRQWFPPLPIDHWYCIFRVPSSRVGNLDFQPPQFMQAAGQANRLTVEVRIYEPNRVGLYVVGRPEALAEIETETIKADRRVLKVRPAEVLSAAEGVELFTYFYHHDTIPEGWHLRERLLL